MRVLIADVATNRERLANTIAQWGYDVVTADDGLQAAGMLESDSEIRLLIIDGMMCVMNGLELCRHVRSLKSTRAIYVIATISGFDAGKLAEAMEIAVDDLLAKPFNECELKARMRAGERILGLEKKLAQKDDLLNEISVKVSKENSTITRDLEYAGQLQRSLLPKSVLDMPGVQFASLFCPCSEVGGDTFNFFRLDERHVGFYHLDVAGHGLPSAMLSVSLNKVFSPMGLLKHIDPTTDEGYSLVPPEQVAADLNSRFQTDDDNILYITMVYGLLNVDTGHLSLTPAGHPNPLHVFRREANYLAESSFPIGMFPDLVYDRIEMTLEKGSRLFLYSDGITECTNSNGTMFSDDRFKDICVETSAIPLPEAINRIEQQLTNWHGSNNFEDDVSMLAMEF